MNVDATVRDLIWHFPHQYGSRADALYYLFYVPGNGFEWIDGELTATSPLSPDADAYSDWRKSSVFTSIYKSGLVSANQLNIRDARWNAVVDMARRDIDVLAQKSEFVRRRFHNQVAAPMIRKIPIDVTGDWCSARGEIYTRVTLEMDKKAIEYQNLLESMKKGVPHG